jgi:DNA repair ATPase RecN
MGDYHILIEKSASIDSTTTHVKALEARGKVNEISRLLDGNIDSEISTDHAKKLISSVEEEKVLASCDENKGDRI